jgi:predicted Zn-dependent protease
MALLRVSVRLAVLSSILLSSALYGQSGDDAAIQRYSEDGQRALASGQYDVAEQNFVALEKLSPRIAEVHASLAAIYFEEKRFEQAVDEIHLALKLKPSLTKLHSLLAISLAELGRYQEALPGLQLSFAQSTDAEVRRMCGLQLMRTYTGLNENAKAVETALKLDHDFPNDPEILYNTGKVYGNYAYLTISKLAQDAPNSIWRHLAAAEAYESQGSALEALSEYQAVLTLDPHRRGIHYRMGRTLLAQYHQTGNTANLADAQKQFELELLADPGNGNAAYEIAEMHRKAGDYEQAEQYFQQALARFNDFEEARVGLAGVLIAENKPGPVAEQLHAAIALRADDEVAWYRLSQVERSLGHADEQKDALAHFQRLHQASIDQRAKLPVAANDEITRQKVEPDGNP